MQVTNRTHLQARLQNTIFMVLLFTIMGLIAWLSIRYEIQADWTVNNRHTLSEASKKILAELTEPIKITVYVTKDNELRTAVRELIARYQRQADNMTLHFVDPFYAPNEARQQDIQNKGEVRIQYKDRTEHLQFLSEQELTSALQRLLRPPRLAVFLEGHGERSPTKPENHDLSEWAKTLKKIGVKVQTLNFGEVPAMPTEADVLVIASARHKFLPGEITLIADYIDKGGNLLWLIDPETPLHSLELETLAKKIGLTIQPGIIVDPISQLFVNNPAVVSITTTGYGEHPVTSRIKQEVLTLFPHASSLIVVPPEDEGWEEMALLTTNQQTWSETETEGTVEFNEETDIDGPLNIAFALVRDKSESADHSEAHDDSEEHEEHNVESDDANKTENEIQNGIADKENDAKTENENKNSVADNVADIETDDVHVHDDTYEEQRLIIVGDGDFLSNAFLGYGGNLDLGLKMINWLATDDTLIDIPSKTAVDLDLELSSSAVILLGGIFLFILPLGLIGMGISVWLWRRKA
jgi:ABC-type uncharacterized transport system involved in gliding motility auxiliary subunit